MKQILVGYTGFVGSNLCDRHEFDLLCNSKNIRKAFGTYPDLLVYAGVPAQKFLANQNPEADLAVIENAIKNIQKIKPKKLVLISTIDVFHNPDNVNEKSKEDFEKEQAYGRNRRYLEEWVEKNIDDYLIVRLPGLYGKNLKKNFIFDYINYIPNLLNEAKMQELATVEPDIFDYYEKAENNFYKVKELTSRERGKLVGILKRVGFSALNFTDSRGTYQFYNLAYLWEHIETALKNNLRVLHLATEPITIGELYNYLTGEEFVNEIETTVPRYNFVTEHGTHAVGDTEGYLFDKEFVLDDIRKFVEEQKRKEGDIKLAISNIAWGEGLDTPVYQWLTSNYIHGLEIAPTRIVAKNPYDEANIEKAKITLDRIEKRYALEVVSMQSIWFGHLENIFASEEDYQILKDYTFRAILYAEAIGCSNLVFGCPKNRNMTNPDKQMEVAVRFFNEIGEFAAEHNTIIALEPNPVIYQTNFINTTSEAVDFVRRLSAKGVKINYDLGTVIQNKENLQVLRDNIELVNHIHISEPNLVKIKKRTLHRDLFKLLKELRYDKYVSVEMGAQKGLLDIEEVMTYLQEEMEES